MSKFFDKCCFWLKIFFWIFKSWFSESRKSELSNGMSTMKFQQTLMILEHCKDPNHWSFVAFSTFSHFLLKKQQIHFWFGALQCSKIINVCWSTFHLKAQTFYFQKIKIWKPQNNLNQIQHLLKICLSFNLNYLISKIT